MIDLDPAYLSIIKDILNNYVPEKKVWVFGSRITGKAREGSDIDLVVIDDNDVTTLDMMPSLRSAFSDSNLPIFVDIFAWSEIPEHFKDEITKRHEILT
jgi:predicted nucleotidyltransferase